MPSIASKRVPRDRVIASVSPTRPALDTKYGTADFVRHYFFGGGRPVDLGAVGLLGRFRRARSVRNAVETYRWKLITRARGDARAICRNAPSGVISRTLTDRDTTITDVTPEPALFAVGRSTFFRYARYEFIVNCQRSILQLEGLLTFEIQDRFEDALDFASDTAGNQEVPRGRPYPITARWTEPLKWVQQL